MHTLRASSLVLLLVALSLSASAQRPESGRVTSRALLAFLPASMAGARASSREVIDAYGVHADYRTPTGFINVNIGISRDIAFDRAQLRGIEEDAPVRNERAGFERHGVTIGRFRALRIGYLSGLKTDMDMLIGDRIVLSVSREGAIPTSEMVALVEALDLEGLARLAARIPAPSE